MRKTVVFDIIKFEDTSLAARSRVHPYCTCGIGYGSELIMRTKRAFIESLQYRIKRDLKLGHEPLIGEARSEGSVAATLEA